MMILKTLANTRVDRLTFWIIFAVVRAGVLRREGRR